MLLLAGVLGLAISACNKEESVVPAPEQPEAEYVTVSLGLAGEYIELSESPMATRAGADTTDWIAIKVMTLSENNEESNYAYGIFNSLENVSIKLLAGQRYKFAASILVDGHAREYSDSGHCCIGFGVASLTDEFVYTPNHSIENFYNIDNFYSNKAHDFFHDRFYGELAEYSPQQAGDVRIEVKRVAYGAHYIAEGLTEGSINVIVTHDGWVHFPLSISAEKPEFEGVFSFRNLYEAWRGRYDYENDCYVDDYSETKSLAISWTKADGSIVPLGSYSVTFKRNVMTTIRIKVEEAATPNGIVVVRKDDALSADQNEYVISGGQVVEVPVTQQ